MAGTLTISTLSDGTNSTSSTNCIKGPALAWLNFSAGASVATVNAAYNVSSVTRNGSGDYTVTFTNAFSDNKYAVVGGSGGSLAGGSSGAFTCPYYNAAPTTTTSRCQTVTYAGALSDSFTYSIAFFR